MSARPPRARDEGQALVEFTLVLPLFVVLVLAIAQFGVAFHHYLVLTDAVRAGARKAAVSRQESDPAGVASDQVRSSASDLDLTKLSVNVSSDWQAAHDVTVSASYPYQINLLGLVVASGQLKSSTTERVE